MRTSGFCALRGSALSEWPEPVCASVSFWRAAQGMKIKGALLNVMYIASVYVIPPMCLGGGLERQSLRMPECARSSMLPASGSRTGPDDRPGPSRKLVFVE